VRSLEFSSSLTRECACISTVASGQLEIKATAVMAQKILIMRHEKHEKIVLNYMEQLVFSFINMSYCYWISIFSFDFTNRFYIYSLSNRTLYSSLIYIHEQPPKCSIIFVLENEGQVAIFLMFSE
jgi:hypothetical protein